MAAPFSKADLIIEIEANIGSQTAPESITPAILDQTLDDMVNSSWNLIDNPGLDNPDANSQGLPGEFAACVVDCALQVLSNASTTILNFPDDRDRGSFDNGNNWLLSKYTTPLSGFTGKITVSGLILNLVEADINPGGSIQVDIEIVKNRLTAPSVLATGSLLAFDDTSVDGDKRYLPDLHAGTDGAPITLLSGDTIEIRATATGSVPGQSIVQLSSGLLTAQKV